MKKVSNQSNSNTIIPNPNKIKNIGFTEPNFNILSNYSKKAYSYEANGKFSHINKILKNDTIFVPEHEPKTIRIASYNVHNWITLQKDYPKKRNINNFIQFFKVLNADIICLQEVVPIFNYEIKNNTKYSSIKDYNFKYLIKLMKDIGYNHHAIINNISDNTYHTEKNNNYYTLGNAIFSKINFEKEIIQLTGNRSAIVAHFNENDFDFIIINTHLEYTNKFFDKNKLKKEFNKNDIRNIQVSQLLELQKIYQEKYKTNNIFLCGDLNDHFKSKILKDIFKEFISLKINQKTNLNQNNTTDFILPSKNTLKNIFIYDYDAIPARLSDHFPILLDFIPNSQKNNIQLLSKKKKILSITKNTINPYYISNFSTNDITKYIQFNLSDKIIDQYYLDIKQWYYYPDLKPMYNIDSYDYIKLVKKLTEENDYYKLYSKIAEYYQGKPITINQNTIKYQSYIEDMLLQFIKCRPKMKVITIWPQINYNKYQKEFKEILEQNGNIYYEKEIELDYEGAMSLMYQIYLTTNRNKTISHLNFNVKQKGWTDKSPKKIFIIFYEHKSKNEISGSESEFKTKLRSLWKTNNIRPYDILHINDYFQETVDYATLYLNKNSLKLLVRQDIKNFIKITSYNELVYINTLKKTFYQNFSQNELINFILQSSIILYTLGLRKFNDIDGFIYPFKASKEFEKKYNEFFDVSSNSFIPFVDISYHNAKIYEEYQIKFFDKVAYMINKVDYRTIVYDPNYHYYFFGLKMQNLELEIIKRIYRFRPSSWADVIMIKDKYNYPIYFPKIPSSIKYYYKDKLDKNELINNIAFYLKEKYKIKKNKDEIEKMISNKEITTNIDNKNINKDFKYFSEILS